MRTQITFSTTTFLALSVTLATGTLFGGCGVRTESGPDDLTEAASSALTGPACTSHNVRVLDVQADFRDVWAGREAAATGKQADPSGQVAVDFSTTVQSSLVNATFTPTGASGNCGAAVAATPIATVAGPAVWGTQTSDASRPAAPAPYNLLVRETASGVVSAAGPVAAGGDVTFSSFSVNGSAKQAVGLIAGGRATLASGSIAGDLTFGVASTVPATVTVTGKKSQVAFDIANAFKTLETLSTLLAGLASTGTVQSANGNLQLTGSSTSLNVFQISADMLKQAFSIAISVPAGASTIISVSGTSVDILSKGISIQGATASTLLWNLGDARFLHIGSVSLPGSILAPRANLTFDSGSLSGTVVVRSFLSAGSGSLLMAPLKASSVFAQSTPSEVALMAAHPLVGGCTYQFQIPSSPALTSAGACLSAPLSVTFTVAAHPMTPAARELSHVQPDATTHTLGRFTARAGINTPIDAALTRYASAIGISSANLVATGTSVPSATRPGQTITQYQQYAQGYPVAGFGYFVASANGIFRAANGRVAPSLPALPVVPSQTITASAALQKALAFLRITQAPWVKSPSQFKAPAGTLVVVAKTSFPVTGSDFVLAWSFPLGKAAGIGSPADIQVDAVSGAIVGASPGKRAITFLDTRATYNNAQIDSIVDTIYSGQRHFSAAQYKNPDTSLVTTLSSKAVTADGALITATGIGLDSSTVPFGFSQYPLDPTPATAWTTTEPDEEAMASAEWALQLSSTFLSSLNLQVGVIPWQTVDGIGHQKVLVNYVTNAPANTNPSFYYSTFSDAETANIYLVAKPSQLHVAPDDLSHEFSHALLDSLRRGNNLVTLNGIKEAGAIDEGLADLFAIAFNHKQLTGVSDPWSCVNFQGASGGTTSCARNIADPHASELPDLYLDGGLGFYIDYTKADPSLCKDDVNDSCGVHDNSTIVSHWGYLLGAGSAGLAKVPCNLLVAPLDSSSIDNGLRTALDVAYLAAGTRTALGGTGLPTAATFAQFRDATMQVAEELVTEGQLTDDAVAKIGLAWSAVGLPPAGGGVTSAEPANQSGVYPWATFVWPTASEDGQTGSSWDFQIANVDFAGGLLYQNLDGITGTVTQNNATMGALPLALPTKSSDTFLWRVRPHSSDTTWASCYPVYSFTGTTEPDPVTNLKVASDLDSQSGDVIPGPFSLTWDVVQGTQPPDYNVKVATHDPQCQSAAGVTDVAETGLSTDGTTETDDVGFVTQPKTTYFVDVQPVGPNGFDGAPALGGCFPLQFTTAALPPPQVDTFAPTLLFGAPWSTQLSWQAFGGAAKSLVYLYERDENGNCGTTPIGSPIEVELTGDASHENASLNQLPGTDSVPNPTGYCWSVVDVAADGTQSAASASGSFVFETLPVSKTSPGSAINLVDNKGPSPLPGGLNTFGQPVLFTWDTTDRTSGGLPAAPAYGIKIGRWPWLGIATPDPANCRGNSCLVGPAVSSTLFETTVRGAGEYMASGDVAAKGRYCWTVWPIYDDPEAPGTPWARQPFVRVDPQFCYTSGPDKPSVTCANVPGPGYSPDPISCEAVFPFAPDGQINIEVDGATAQSDLALVENCSVDPATTEFYNDLYDCHIKFTISNIKPSNDYVVKALAYNSDKYPAVKDATTLAQEGDYPFTTGSCGDQGKDCCANQKCNATNLVCTDDTTVASKHSCKPKPPNLPAPQLVYDTVCDPALKTGLFNDGTEFVIGDVPTADEFEFEFIDPDTTDVTARMLASCTPLQGTDFFCPATSDNQTLVCTIPPKETWSFHWGDDQEDAANQTAIALRNGFRYAYFHVRGRDSGSGAAGEFSREGVMVSCIDQNVCTFDQNNQLVVPHFDTPVPNPPTTIEVTCDDVKLVQEAKGVAPAGSCVAW